MRRKLAAWVALMLVVAVAGVREQLDKRIQDSEDLVRKLQEMATDIYARRSSIVPDCSCSVHGCTNIIPPDAECSDLLGHSEEICGRCETRGKQLDFFQSMVRTPPGEDPEKLSAAVKESICTFQPLDKVFRETGPAGNFTWTYVATTSGVHKVYPGLAIERGFPEVDPQRPLDTCRQFDPRVRPWFNAASSGPKDVVIVLDTSESMGKALGSSGKTRWEVTRDAISRLLGTFGISDFVSVVTFNSESEALGGETTLVRANNTNIEMLRSQVMDVTPKSKTNFRKGFQTAFDVLIRSSKLANEKDIPPTSSCTKVILFLTDGEDCSINDAQSCGDSGNTEENADDVPDFIKAKQSELMALGSEGAHIFTFSMTSEADDKLAKMIACENNGSWTSISEKDDPLLKFLDYIRFLAWTRQGLDVIWSNFYIDGDGLGEMSTAVMPVYAPNIVSAVTGKNISGLLVAVVAKDVLVRHLAEDDADFKVVFDRLIERSSVCRKIEEDVCQLQVLRGEKSECPDIFPKRPCYYSGRERKYYTVELQTKLPFEEAADKCMELGGHLAEPKSAEVQAFLAGLATREGCWIGLRFDGGFRWRWSSSGEEAEPLPKADPEKSSFWASRALQEDNCAAMDRRGLRKNVFVAPCQKEMPFICEFDEMKPPDQCSGTDTLGVPVRNFSMVPPISLCGDYEEARLASIEVVNETHEVDSKTALCSLGSPEIPTEEAQCCSCCDRGTDARPCKDNPRDP